LVTSKSKRNPSAVSRASGRSRTPREFLVRFRGVRGSFPVCGPDVLKIGGNTSCVELRVNGHLIILDAGTGLVALGDDLIREHASFDDDPERRRPIRGVMLLTHAHHDHTQGFPFFKPAYLGTSTFHIFGPRIFNQDFRDIMSRAMLAPLFPVDLDEMTSTRNIHNIEEYMHVVLDPDEPSPRIFDIYRDPPATAGDGSVVITNLRNLAHPKGGCVNFRIQANGKSMVYATDVEGFVGGDSRLVAFARGADLLIHDAQYLPSEYSRMPVPTQGYGHSTFEMACQVAKAAGVGDLALFHHDPSHDDEAVRQKEADARRLFPRTFAAHEGMEVRL
jgi:phosphoribosyl 1,2-cyclic phosphodiesterase